MVKVFEAETRITLRIPSYLHSQLVQSAEANARSMNGEIVARLQESFSGPFNELSSIGLTALIKRLEAIVEVSDDLFMRQRDALKELESRLSETKE